MYEIVWVINWKHIHLMSFYKRFLCFSECCVISFIELYISYFSFSHVPQHNNRWSPHSASLMVCLMWGCCISLLRLSQLLLDHISPENVGKVEYETQILLFFVYLHFLEDVIIKLTPGMGLVPCWIISSLFFLLAKSNGKRSRLLIFSRLLVSLVKITNVTDGCT